jgi:starvation-inducible outer membrane lipoprotein
MNMKTTTFILLLAVVLSACAPFGTPAPTAIPTQDPKALAAELDALVPANNQAGTLTIKPSSSF